MTETETEIEVRKTTIYPLPSRHRSVFFQYNDKTILTGCFCEAEEKKIIFRKKYGDGAEHLVDAKIPDVIWLHALSKIKDAYYFNQYFRILQVKSDGKDKFVFKGYQPANVDCNGHICQRGPIAKHLKGIVNDFWMSPFTDSMGFLSSGYDYKISLEENFKNVFKNYNGDLTGGTWRSLPEIISDWLGVDFSQQKPLISLSPQDGIFVTQSKNKIEEVGWAIQGDDYQWCQKIEEKLEKIDGEIVQ